MGRLSPGFAERHAVGDGERRWKPHVARSGSERHFRASRAVGQWLGRGPGATTGQRSSSLAAGVYALRIQYYDLGGDNSFALVESPFTPAAFVPTATNPRQVVQVLVLNYDPRVPAQQNQRVHEVFGWTAPRRLAAEFEGDIEWASGGAVDLEVVEWRDLEEFPAARDGYRYTPDEYVSNWSSHSGWHDSATDFYRLAEEQGLAERINCHTIDEVWCFGPPGVDLFGEAWMFGPNAFFINGPTFPEVGIDRAVAGYGFNYERGVGCMIEDLGHRTENHGSRAYGGWHLAEPTSSWDYFTANYLESPAGTYGVGTCHVPANADGHYDWADTRIVESSAYDWVNYPNLTGATSPVSLDDWAFGSYPDYQRDYFNWFYGLLPRADGPPRMAGKLTGTNTSTTSTATKTSGTGAQRRRLCRRGHCEPGGRHRLRVHGHVLRPDRHRRGSDRCGRRTRRRSGRLRCGCRPGGHGHAAADHGRDDTHGHLPNYPSRRRLGSRRQRHLSHRAAGRPGAGYVGQCGARG